MIAYKVVDRKSRRGVNWAYFTRSNSRLLSNNFSRRHKRRIIQKLSEYFPVYKKGAVINKVPSSVGILCFRKKADAAGFVNFNGLSSPPYDCILVKVQGEGITTPIKIVMGANRNPTILTTDAIKEYRSPPTGTIAFEIITVLE